MEFVIQVLKQKKEDLIKEYEGKTSLMETTALKYMCDNLDKAVRTLEYEYYWKGKSEKQIDEILGIRKKGR